MFFHFCDCQRKGPRSKWTIFNNQKSDKNKKCLSVVVNNASIAYTSLCRGLKNLQKIFYLKLSQHCWILDFQDSLFGLDENITIINNICVCQHIY